MSDQSIKQRSFFWRIFLVGLVVMLIVGVAIGYGIWGRRNDTPDVKRLLTDIQTYIETIEKENADLKKQIKKMKGTVDKSIESVESMKRDLVDLQGENEKLTDRAKNPTSPNKQRTSDDWQK